DRPGPVPVPEHAADPRCRRSDERGLSPPFARSRRAGAGIFQLRRRAQADARGYGCMKSESAISSPYERQAPAPALGLAADLVLTPLSRQPMTLPLSTVQWALKRPIPLAAPLLHPPTASVIIVTFKNLALTRLAIESV